MINNIMVCDYRNNHGLDQDVAQALTKYIIEAANICSLKDYRVRVICGNYLFDFSTSDAVTQAEIIDKLESDKLIISFYELTYDMELPILKNHTLKLAFIAKEDDGTRNIAVESNLNLTFAKKIFEVIDLFKTRFIKDSATHFIKNAGSVTVEKLIL